MIKKAFLALCAASTFLASSSVLALSSCEDEIKNINLLMTSQGMKPVIDIDDLAKTIRTYNQLKRFPDKYITSDQAKSLGWSGNSGESLWGPKPTNRKWIGGDLYNHHSLPKQDKWYTADLDVVKGYRSSKKIIVSPNTTSKFITTDHFQHIVELDPCK